jgi:LuxR family maltose regulon positive regulatory protein
LSDQILATKLYVPTPQPEAVPRLRLIARLNDGLHRKLTLVSAPAGFGMTTAVSVWVAGCGRPVAWLSLDAGDSDPARFVAYLIAALQTIQGSIGQGLVGALRSPQPPAIESLLTALLNDIATVPDAFLLVLDDYHVIDAQPIDAALAFLLDHLPPQMHLIITTREDPRLPLARLRARGQLTELRATDLRFTASEAAAFLNEAMGLNLSDTDITALETRTEGWIAGLQLAAISMRGQEDATRFITSFTGSHRFVLDYLLEEVLHQQSASVQAFLLHTSILDRLCGPLCDAVLLDPSASGRDTLEYLEHINLFIVPLDNERRWYRYHHLFAELLRQRLHQSVVAQGESVADLHVRASAWFEEQGLELEAFHHAAAANDIERAERLINGKGMPLYVRGLFAPVVTWLESLPTTVLDARPSLWVMFATALSVAGAVTRVEPILQAAEAALRDLPPDDETRALNGRIADMRALLGLLAADPRQIDATIAQSRSVLEHLPADNIRARATAIWRLGLAHEHRGDRAEARQALTEAIVTSEQSGNLHIDILATTCLGRVQESDNQLHQAVETYRRVLHLVGEPPGPVACEAHVGLARIFYEWNDLDAAHQHGLLSVKLAHQVEIASFVSCELFLARLQLARDDVSGALASLAQTEQTVRQRGFLFRMPWVAAAQVRALLRQGSIAEAARLAETYDLPLSQARVHLARGDTSAALTALETVRQQAELRGWADQRLMVTVLQAVALHARGDRDTAVQMLGDALALAEPSGFTRLFLDERLPMAGLLSDAIVAGIRPDYAGRLLAALEAETRTGNEASTLQPTPNQPLIEPLSRRELEVLHLIAQGLSNREISERLFLALNTVKGHNRVIFDKLMVERRTEAVARARELGLL